MNDLAGLRDKLSIVGMIILFTNIVLALFIKKESYKIVFCGLVCAMFASVSLMYTLAFLIPGLILLINEKKKSIIDYILIFALFYCMCPFFGIFKMPAFKYDGASYGYFFTFFVLQIMLLAILVCNTYLGVRSLINIIKNTKLKETILYFFYDFRKFERRIENIKLKASESEKIVYIFASNLSKKTFFGLLLFLVLFFSIIRWFFQKYVKSITMRKLKNVYNGGF